MSKSLKLLTLSLLLATTALPALARPLALGDLIKLRPGEKAPLTKTEGSIQGADYEIEFKKDDIFSVRIDFHMPQATERFLKKDTKGFCIIQKPAGDIPLNRVFFYYPKNKTRYELTPMGEIKSILIQDLTQAHTQKPCQFQEAQKLGAQK